MRKDDVRAAFELIDKIPLCLGESGGTAQLVDESDEDGLVVIKNEAGDPVLCMPRHDYDAIKAWEPNG